ncbi:Lactose permease [Psilocybe cubensis]|uniref:Lactose permease n=1 Tax=Psilocybe cubensis TaxID=181762 RepID=A0ACB8HCN8_PSICU|nr:Lactose permease [Psilocybe cubensis]KAH9484925.1 Lactose permease [Psilocybe cubensis]
MINGLQSVTEWEKFFNFPAGGKLGLFNAIQNIGSLCAYPFAPYIADGLGRRSTIWMGAAIMVIATVIQTASQNFGMFIGARFLIGFGLTFGASSAPLLITEIAYPTQRAQLTSVYNSLWYEPHQSHQSITESSFNLQGILEASLPESPRWLVGRGRESEALETLAYYHADGDRNDPLVQWEFEEIKAALAFDREVAANVGWLSLFSTPGNRRRMRIIVALAFFSQWSGNGLGCIVAVSSGFLCERVGRRPLFLSSCLGLLLTWTLETICFAVYSETGDKAAGNAVVAMMSFCYFFVVETKNRSLEETAALFDGTEAVLMVTEKAAENAGLKKRLANEESKKESSEKIEQAMIEQI